MWTKTEPLWKPRTVILIARSHEGSIDSGGPLKATARSAVRDHVGFVWDRIDAHFRAHTAYQNAEIAMNPTKTTAP